MEGLEAELQARLSRRLRELLHSELPGQAYMAEGLDIDLAVAYSASLLRVLEEWLRWEATCKDRRLPERSGYCSEVERRVSSGDRTVGVVSYFNTELKRMLVRLVRDFAPLPELPSWVIFYSTFQLREPVVLHLAKLGPGEQLLRAPAYAAVISLLDSAARGVEEHYVGLDAPIAATTASYIYWELVKPLSVYVDAYERVTGIEAHGLREKVRQETREKGQLRGARLYLEALYRLYARGLMRAIR